MKFQLVFKGNLVLYYWVDWVDCNTSSTGKVRVGAKIYHVGKLVFKLIFILVLGGLGTGSTTFVVLLGGLGTSSTAVVLLLGGLGTSSTTVVLLGGLGTSCSTAVVLLGGFVCPETHQRTKKVRGHYKSDLGAVYLPASVINCCTIHRTPALYV